MKLKEQKIKSSEIRVSAPSPEIAKQFTEWLLNEGFDKFSEIAKIDGVSVIPPREDQQFHEVLFVYEGE